MPVGLLVQVARGGQMVAQHQFDLTKRVVKIGRSPSAHIRIEDPAASRVHAVLEISPSGVTLVDLGASAGTLMNGARVSRAAISPGDQIVIGETTLFISMNETAQPAAPVGPLYQPPATRPPVTAPAVAPTAPRSAPSPFAPAPRPTAVAAPSPAAEAPNAAAPSPPRRVEPESLNTNDVLPDSDPIMERMRRARRRSLLIGGGAVVVVAAIVALIAVFHEPRPTASLEPAVEAKAKALPGDPGPSEAKPGDPAAPPAAIEAEVKAAAPFDVAEPRDEAQYLYHRVSSPTTVEAVAVSLYGNAARLRLILSANPGLKAGGDALAAEVELRAPRFAVYEVKAGDTLGKIAAAELGAEEVYPRILDANKELLPTPEDLAPGMKLKIPVLKPGS